MHPFGSHLEARKLPASVLERCVWFFSRREKSYMKSAANRSLGEGAPVVDAGSEIQLIVRFSRKTHLDRYSLRQFSPTKQTGGLPANFEA